LGNGGGFDRGSGGARRGGFEGDEEEEIGLLDSALLPANRAPRAITPCIQVTLLRSPSSLSTHSAFTLINHTTSLTIEDKEEW